jgi:hypothetical protein
VPKRVQTSVELNGINNMELKDKRYNDIRLIFHEEEHKYNDSLGNDYISTTTILHNYAPKFDKNYWLRKKSKELGISEKKLEEQWSTITKEACERGTNTHNGLEDGVKGASMFQQAINYLDKREDGVMVTIADIPNFGASYKLLNLKDFIELTNNRYPLIYDAFKMYTEKGYKIYSEIGMFLIDWLISGTIDILLVNEDTNCAVVGDWKTNRGGLKFSSGYYKKDKTVRPAQQTNVWVDKDERLLAPLNHLPNCNGAIHNLFIKSSTNPTSKIFDIVSFASNIIIISNTFKFIFSYKIISTNCSIRLISIKRILSSTK